MCKLSIPPYWEDATRTAREEIRTTNASTKPDLHAIRAARDDARRAVQDVLLRLEAAALTPDGVTSEMEQERDRALAALRRSVRELERLLAATAPA